MPDGFFIDRTAAGDGRLAFRGKCGPEESEEAEEALAELLERAGGDYVVDLTGMTYFSSGCIGSLIAFVSDAERRGAAVTVLAAGKVGRVLDIMSVGSVCELRLAGA